MGLVFLFTPHSLPTPKSLSIRTYRLTPQIAAQTKPSEGRAMPSKKSETKGPLKKQEPAKGIEKKESAKKAPQGNQGKSTKGQSESVQALAKEVENLLKMEAPSKHAPLTLPTLLPAPSTSPPPSGYTERIMEFLTQHLQLPEVGEVLVRLEIARDGTLLQLEILESKNATNSAYLKKRLPELAFPCFNEFALKEHSLLFTIAFHNAD
ncbi:MAG: hypothetical protein KGI80_03835 [Verrucomicrobiota bacterium]|nr:hypothetical protein [Verrucomicrobiota bacterium]